MSDKYVYETEHAAAYAALGVVPTGPPQGQLDTNPDWFSKMQEHKTPEWFAKNARKTHKESTGS